MTVLQNTLYVQTQGAHVRLDHDAARVDCDGEMRARVPLLRLSSVVLFGNVTVSSTFMQRCAEDGRSLAWMSTTGRFRARIEGPVRGNVMLRRAQHHGAGNESLSLDIGRNIVAGKIQNSRQVLLRAARDHTDVSKGQRLTDAAHHLAGSLGLLRVAPSLDAVRGIEGNAARMYFGVFRDIIRRTEFEMNGRSRRPPRDPINAMLSFVYALLRTECMAALEGVGLDPYIGFLHVLRPGRPALALDLMEELRAPVADRLVLRLLNLGQITKRHFEFHPGGAVGLTEAGRREVLDTYQRRKQEPVRHMVLDAKVPLGLVPHVQGRLLARTLRGDLTHYPPFLLR